MTEMSSYEEWSPGWIPEGYYIKYVDTVDNVERFGFVERREFLHYEFEWPRSVSPGDLVGPEVVDELEVTINRTHLWQVIFGFKYKGYYYVHLPIDITRHGAPKRVKPTTDFPTVAHYEEWMSPWDQPDWVTEHFLVRPITPYIGFSYMNTNDFSVTPKINIFVNKCELTLLGYVKDGVIHPSKEDYREILDKLNRRVKPFRPVTLMPIRLPAEAP